MYKSFFGLRENPFNVNPDPRYLHLTSNMQKASDQLKYGVQHCKGLILLTGEVGTGKTTLINCILNSLREQNTPTAFIFNYHLTVNHLLDFILTDFGIPIDFRLNGNMLMRLKMWLLEQFRAGKKPVLIVDEAQGLSIEALEEIRLLLNLETGEEKLIRIVLVGQPELEEKLRRPELKQLRQRIEMRCSTAPLRLEESRSYIAERLRIAGANGTPIFPAETMDLAHAYSQGIPRVINILCEHALINAYAEQCRQVPAWAVEEAARDFHLTVNRLGGSRDRNGGADGTGVNPPAMQAVLEEELISPVAEAWPIAATSFAADESPVTTSKVLLFRPQSGASALTESNAVPAIDDSRWIRSLLYVLELWERASLAIQRNKQSIYFEQIVKCWIADFRRDWRAMMSALDLGQAGKIVLRWLRQPTASKRMDSGRKQAV